MSLLIEDSETLALVDELARRLGMSGEAVVRTLVKSELEKDRGQPTPAVEPMRAELAALLLRHPKPDRNGRAVGKAFYDDLSGECG